MSGEPSCSHKKLKSAYELKIYSIALTNLVFQSTGNTQTDAALPRASLLRQTVFALTRQQRSEQRTLAKATAKQLKAQKKKTGGKEEHKKNTLISQMVDNILKDSAEVGFSSGDDDADLSGDDVKTPIFVIKKDRLEEAANQMEEDAEIDGDGDSAAEEDYGECYVQEEFGLA